MARYSAPLNAALKGRAWWSVTLFERTHVALEQDFLTGRAFMERLRCKKADAEEAPNRSTTARGVQIDDKTIKSCARNALVISVLTYRQPEHQRCINVVCAVAEPLSAFHSEQNKACFCFVLEGRNTSCPKLKGAEPTNGNSSADEQRTELGPAREPN